VLTEQLCQRGYQAIDPATLSIPEQKWVFKNARHIVSENGASLINMIFCDPKKTRMDTIMVSKYATPTFQVLAASLGLDLQTHIVPSQNVGDEIHATIPQEIMNIFVHPKLQKTG
jgi:capsular polysaccharide biosynthesis protein